MPRNKNVKDVAKSTYLGTMMVTLTMEAASTSATLVILHQSTQNNNPEVSHHHHQ
jgi:hypothetical protein